LIDPCYATGGNPIIETKNSLGPTYGGLITRQGPHEAEKGRGSMKQQKTMGRRNAPAAALTDPRYRPRCVKSAKVYDRKNAPDPAEGADT